MKEDSISQEPGGAAHGLAARAGGVRGQRQVGKGHKALPGALPKIATAGLLTRIYPQGADSRNFLELLAIQNISPVNLKCKVRLELWGPPGEELHWLRPEWIWGTSNLLWHGNNHHSK